MFFSILGFYFHVSMKSWTLKACMISTVTSTNNNLEGGRGVKRNIEHYHLDMIISIGYRVKSKRGIVLDDGQIKI